MAVFWLTPSAWWGLAALTIPIAIHLLTRQHTRRVPFPTLRFLRATRLAALRRRSIHEIPLLVVRVLILTAAVAALAGPVFVSAARQAEWQTRVARALVVAPSSSPDPRLQDSVTSEEARTSFASAVFRPATHLADGMLDAVDWLNQQPPAARELVVIGDLREGTLAEPDLAIVPPSIGLRFLPTPDVAARGASAELPFGRLTLLHDRTLVEYRDATDAATAAISVRAAPADEQFARAARDAVVARGTRLDRASARRVLVIFEGADASNIRVEQPADSAWMREALAHLPGMTGGQAGDRLVVRVSRRADDVEAARVIDRIARVAFGEDLRALEPRLISAAILARWSRSPQPVMDAPLSDEGDRRWLWALALVLVAIETIVRRAKTAAVNPLPVEEQRIA